MIPPNAWRQQEVLVDLQDRQHRRLSFRGWTSRIVGIELRLLRVEWISRTVCELDVGEHEKIRRSELPVDVSLWSWSLLRLLKGLSNPGSVFVFDSNFMAKLGRFGRLMEELRSSKAFENALLTSNFMNLRKHAALQSSSIIIVSRYCSVNECNLTEQESIEVDQSKRFFCQRTAAL